MTEADLARPVVEVRDFETNALEYEIYTYGEENVIVPVSSEKKESGLLKLAKKQIINEVRRFDRDADVEIVGDNKVIVRVENDVIARIIGKGGENIKALEERLGIRIEVSPKIATLGKEASFTKEETGAYMVFTLDAKPNKIANFYVDGEYLFSATIGKNSQIRVSKDSDVGHDILRAVLNRKLKVFV